MRGLRGLRRIGALTADFTSSSQLSRHQGMRVAFMHLARQRVSVSNDRNAMQQEKKQKTKTDPVP